MEGPGKSEQAGKEQLFSGPGCIVCFKGRARWLWLEMVSLKQGIFSRFAHLAAEKATCPKLAQPLPQGRPRALLQLCFPCNLFGPISSQPMPS